MEKKKNYTAPLLEIIEIKSENGFAGSAIGAEDALWVDDSRNCRREP